MSFGTVVFGTILTSRSHIPHVILTQLTPSYFPFLIYLGWLRPALHFSPLHGHVHRYTHPYRTTVQGHRKRWTGFLNRYNLKSTERIYKFRILKCSGKFKVLYLPQYISIRATFVALETSKRNSISCHVFWIMSRVTVSMADVILSCRCWIFLIFSAYTMFLVYPPQEKNELGRDLGFEVARVLVHHFQSSHQGISHLKRQ